MHNFAEELNAQLRELSGHLIIACPAPTATTGTGAKANLAGSGAPNDAVAAIALNPDTLPGAAGSSTKGKGGPPCPVIRYIPPAKGTLSMTVVDSLLAKVS